MGTRRNVVMSKTDEAARPKLTAAQQQRIIRLYDKPYTPAEISREVGVPVDAVRQVLAEMVPVDVGRWPI